MDLSGAASKRDMSVGETEVGVVHLTGARTQLLPLRVEPRLEAE